MLSRNHASLGAFTKYQPRWERIADELAHRVRRRLDCEENCCCEDRLWLKVYDEAKWRARTSSPPSTAGRDNESSLS